MERFDETAVHMRTLIFDVLEGNEVSIGDYLAADSSNFIVIDEVTKQVKADNFHSLQDDVTERRGTSIIYECRGPVFPDGSRSIDTVDPKRPYYVLDNNAGVKYAVPLDDLQAVLRDQNRRVWHLVADQRQATLENTVSYWNYHIKKVIPADHRRCDSSTSIRLARLVYCKGTGCVFTKAVRSVHGAPSEARPTWVYGEEPHAKMVNGVYRDLRDTNAELYRKVMSRKELIELSKTEGLSHEDRRQIEDTLNRIQFDDDEMDYTDDFYGDEERDTRNVLAQSVQSGIGEILASVETLVIELGDFLNVDKVLRCLTKYIERLRAIGMGRRGVKRTRTGAETLFKSLDRIDTRHKLESLHEQLAYLRAHGETTDRDDDRVIGALQEKLTRQAMELEARSLFRRGSAECREVSDMAHHILASIASLDDNGIDLIDIEQLALLNGLRRCLAKYLV